MKIIEKHLRLSEDVCDQASKVIIKSAKTITNKKENE